MGRRQLFLLDFTVDHGEGQQCLYNQALIWDISQDSIFNPPYPHESTRGKLLTPMPPILKCPAPYPHAYVRSAPQDEKLLSEAETGKTEVTVEREEHLEDMTTTLASPSTVGVCSQLVM